MLELWRVVLQGLLLAVVLCWSPMALSRGESSTADAVIQVDRLPAEARATLVLIRRGGPFPYRQDGSVFGNRERLLPLRERAYYTEYTVATPGARDRGARRLVVGGEPRGSREVWYTDNHYASFYRVVE